MAPAARQAPRMPSSCRTVILAHPTTNQSGAIEIRPASFKLRATVRLATYARHGMHIAPTENGPRVWWHIDRQTLHPRSRNVTPGSLTCISLSADTQRVYYSYIQKEMHRLHTIIHSKGDAQAAHGDYA